MSRWFRVYDELLDDPKVQRLPAEDFRGWMNLLCLASRNGGRIPPVEDVSFALRVTLDGARTLLERLRSGGLIVRKSGGVDGAFDAPHKWDERQYKSDTSTDRVKRFRQRSATVAETPPEAETEAETEETTSVVLKPRKRGTRLNENWLPSPLTGKVAAMVTRWPAGELAKEWAKFQNYWLSKSGQGATKQDWQRTWVNWLITADERKPQNGQSTDSLTARALQSIGAIPH
jgi:hypothetical protein